MRALPVVGLLGLTCLAACTGNEVPPTGSSSARSTIASVCADATTIEARLREYFTAFNQGDDGAAERFFQGTGSFLWYSEIPYREQREPYSAADDPRKRSSLAAYLRQRHQARETLHLVEVRDNGGGDFGFTVNRTEPGKPRAAIRGKGRIDCGDAKFVALPIGPGPRV